MTRPDRPRNSARPGPGPVAAAAAAAAKRAGDVVVAGTVLLVASPVLAGVALAVALRLGRPVLFRQSRPGRGGELFTLVKFRTMHDVDPRAGRTTDADRLTRLGRALRASSLDELPSLVGVLRGDLSLVGPRPLLPAYLSLYDAEQARRHDVRPGLTGLAQVAGRNALSWEERLRLDVEYVDRASLGLDLRILVRTVGTVLRRTGVTDAGDVSCAPFRGTRPASATDVPGAAA